MIRATQAAKTKSTGRYDGVRSNTREVPGGRAQVNARLRTVQPVPAAVADPYGGRERIIVTVNRRTDLLEMERTEVAPEIWTGWLSGFLA